MTTLSTFKESPKLSRDAVLAEHVEAAQGTTAAEAICGRCHYRRRPMCRDSTRLDREMCPVVRNAREAG